MTNTDVILGQLLAFTIIVAVSLVGSLLHVFIDLKYLALIGFLPLLIGMWQLYKVCKFWCSKCKKSPDDTEVILKVDSQFSHDPASATYSVEVSHVVNPSTERNDEHSIDLEMSREIQVPTDENAKQQRESENYDSDSTDSSSDDDENSFLTYPCQLLGPYCLRPQALSVLVTLLADGAEEVGVFIPLFATSNTPDMITLIVTFYAWLVVQLLFCASIVKVKYVGKYLSRYSKNIMPLLLIGILRCKTDFILYL